MRSLIDGEIIERSGYGGDRSSSGFQDRNTNLKSDRSDTATNAIARLKRDAPELAGALIEDEDHEALLETVLDKHERAKAVMQKAEPLALQGRPSKHAEKGANGTIKRGSNDMVMQNAAPLTTHGTNQHKTGGVNNFKSSQGGNSADYLAAKIKRDLPDIAQRLNLRSSTRNTRPHHHSDRANQETV